MLLFAAVFLSLYDVLLFAAVYSIRTQSLNMVNNHLN